MLLKMDHPKMMILSAILNVLLIAIMTMLCVHYNWVDKIAQRIGWKEIPRSQDYLTTMSWNNTMESLNYEADVVLFGASLTSNGQWQKWFHGSRLCTLGKSGDRLEMMLWRVPQITAVHPRKIFLSMEQNDMPFLSLGEIERGYRKLLDSIQRSNPQARLYLESLTPLNERQYRRVCDNSKIREVNAMINRIADDYSLTYIDIYTIYEENGQMPMTLSYDGQHLRPEAYSRWADAIRTYLEE